MNPKEFEIYKLKRLISMMEEMEEIDKPEFGVNHPTGKRHYIFVLEVPDRPEVDAIINELFEVVEGISSC